MQVLDELVPELLERREADLRKQRAAAKIQTQMNNILPDGEGGYGGRSRRARKEVNYSFDAYDAAIRAALRGTGRNAEEIEARTTRSAALLEPRSAHAQVDCTDQRLLVPAEGTHKDLHVG